VPGRAALWLARGGVVALVVLLMVLLMFTARGLGWLDGLVP
jgi:hypothetical protein